MRCGGKSVSAESSASIDTLFLALSGIMVYPHGGFLRPQERLDLFHRSNRCPMVGIESWYPTATEIFAVMSYIPTEQHWAGLRQADQQRAMAGCMPRREDQTHRAVAENVVIAVYEF